LDLTSILLRLVTWIKGYLLRSKDDLPKTLSFEELASVLDRCKDMASPNI
jgi:hypothetical protein